MENEFDLTNTIFALISISSKVQEELQQELQIESELSERYNDTLNAFENGEAIDDDNSKLSSILDWGNWDMMKVGVGAIAIAVLVLLYVIMSRTTRAEEEDEDGPRWK